MKDRCRRPIGSLPIASSLLGLFALVGLSLATGSSAPADQVPVFLGMWGVNCSVSDSGPDGCDGDFYDPADVAVSESGKVFVADYFNDRIQRFDSGGKFELKWGTSGSGNRQFDGPQGIAVDTSGNVYVADLGNDRIQKFTSDGALVTQWGSYGSGDDQFNSPTDVAVNSVGNVYVTDWFNDRVVRFNSSGTHQLHWGETCDVAVSGAGACDGKFNRPWGIAVDSSYNVYVADAYNHRVQKFSSTGTFLTKWGELCDTNASGVDGCDGDFYLPTGVAVDSSDNIYVTDHYNDRILKFDSAGTFLLKWGSHGFGVSAYPGRFYYPDGVAVDRADEIYIVDTNDRVQKFGDPRLDFFLGEPPTPSTLPR